MTAAEASRAEPEAGRAEAGRAELSAIRRLWARAQRTEAWRAWQRYGVAQGGLLAAGIGYFSFFSLFPAVALAAVVFGFILQGRPDLLAAIGDALNAALPGFVKTDANPSGLVALTAPETATLSWTGAVAIVTLVAGGLGWIGSLGEGLRAMFGVRKHPGNIVVAKVRDLVVLGLLGVALLVSATLTSAVGAAGAWSAQHLGLGEHPWLVGIAGVLVSLLVDMAIMVVLLRVLTGLKLPWPVVRAGALIGGGAMTLLKLVGAQLVTRATSNPVFGSLVVVVGLLFWLNLMAKVVLLSAAWAAGDLDDSGMPSTRAAAAASTQAAGRDMAGPDDADGALDGASGGIDAGDPRARAVNGIPNLGVRSKDRVTLAAGAVLGASAAIAGGAVRRLARPRQR
ncbi:MAG: YihY/virulence factor BrkB family protein [Actinomycetales bacterium]|uniref:YihY/virulence factor BrkB family protein n=1 Tax=Candidatus Phosphoribacter hodrii TaxID=2953743 RepID=A0A935IKL3_9MICO|nr:YihY/virulence factor BrkB family protein [Candidatus Phosphoribacter hodrii]